MPTTSVSIAEALEADIRAGLLAPGSRLPTHRMLAERHGVAVNTATRAMRLLHGRGLVAGEVGRGSFVKAPGHVDSSSFRLEAGAPGSVDLVRNAMFLPGLAERYEAAVEAVLRRNKRELADYQPHAGRPVDRAAGAAWMARGGRLPNEPGRVVVCAGAQHAVTVALMACTRPGDAVAVEQHTWPGIRAAAAALGLELVPVPTDVSGLRPRALLRAAAARRIKALYCMPSLQNPTNAVMPLARREAVVAIARRLQFQIVEDDPYGFLAEPGTSAPLLAALAPERTWHVRSTSKLMLPGLRAAWLLTPPGLATRATELIRATVWTSAPLGAAVATLWVGDGTAEWLEVEKRHEARRRQRMAAAILPGLDGAGPAPPSMHVTLSLPKGLRAQDAVEKVAAGGVRISPGAAFSISGSPNFVRLALGAPDDLQDLRRGLAVVAGLWR